MSSSSSNNTAEGMIHEMIKDFEEMPDLRQRMDSKESAIFNKFDAERMQNKDYKKRNTFEYASAVKKQKLAQAQECIEIAADADFLCDLQTNFLKEKGAMWKNHLQNFEKIIKSKEKSIQHTQTELAAAKTQLAAAQTRQAEMKQKYEAKLNKFKEGLASQKNQQKVVYKDSSATLGQVEDLKKEVSRLTLSEKTLITEKAELVQQYQNVKLTIEAEQRQQLEHERKELLQKERELSALKKYQESIRSETRQMVEHKNAFFAKKAKVEQMQLQFVELRPDGFLEDLGIQNRNEFAGLLKDAIKKKARNGLKTFVIENMEVAGFAFGSPKHMDRFLTPKGVHKSKEYLQQAWDLLKCEEIGDQFPYFFKHMQQYVSLQYMIFKKKFSLESAGTETVEDTEDELDELEAKQ